MTAGTAPRRMLSIITRLGDGGSDQRLYDILAALDDDEHHVVVGGASAPSRVAALAEDHRVTVYPSLVRSVDPRRDAATAARLAREVRGGGYDAVITHQSKAGLIGRVVARLARVPRVYHSASMASFGPGYGRAEDLMFRIAERATGSLVDRYLVVGRDLGDRLADNGVPRHKLTLIRSSIDAAPFLAARSAGRNVARRELHLGDEATVICFVGRLDDRKGAPRLADLFAAVRDGSGRDADLLVAGEGPCAEQLERRIHELGLADHVTLLGHTPRVAQVLAASDLIVLPSSAEGLPQVLVQAAFTGTPFAAFDVDGARELQSLGAIGTVAPIGADEVLIAHAISMLGVERAAAPAWASPLLDQWDRDTVPVQYRAALCS